MPPRIIASPGAPKAIGPYSQAVLLERPARLLYCAGQIPLDPASGERVPGDVAAQAERVFDNIEAVLAAAGMTLANVVKTTVYLTDLADFARMNEVYARRFGSGPYPARSTVPVKELPKGSSIEIEVIAAEG